MSDGDVEVLARGVTVLDGKLLVCHTKGAANTYLPGGHVDFGEGVETALVREIDEEMGRKASVTRFLGGCDHSFSQKGEQHCEVNLVFEMTVDGLVGGEDPSSEEDYIEFLWLDMNELESSNLEPATLRESLTKWLASGDGTNRFLSSSVE